MGYVSSRGRFATDRETECLLRYCKAVYLLAGEHGICYTPACMVWAGGYFQYCNRIGKGRKGYFAADGVSRFGVAKKRGDGVKKYIKGKLQTEIDTYCLSNAHLDVKNLGRQGTVRLPPEDVDDQTDFSRGERNELKMWNTESKIYMSLFQPGESDMGTLRITIAGNFPVPAADYCKIVARDWKEAKLLLDRTREPPMPSRFPRAQGGVMPSEKVGKLSPNVKDVNEAIQPAFFELIRADAMLAF